jgi:hypothetical protein
MCCAGGGTCGDLGLGFGLAPVEAASDGGGDTPSPYRPEGGGTGGCGCDGIERTSCYAAGGEWTEATCSCFSPVLIDVAGDGLRMTDGAGGVLFDFAGDGSPELMSWTETGSDDAWLALDRNGNGRVDDGRELFGTSTPQPAWGGQRNGFAALSVYDRAGNGGNADGVIDARDTIFASLRLWRDVNHNGVSEPPELRTLSSLGVAAVHLDYKESKRTDEHGNRFRFRAKVDDARGERVGRWAWDVFPVKPR